MTREEDLCRRLCKCFGFTVETDIDSLIAIVIPDRSGRRLPTRVRYESWNDVLFGDDDTFGLCEHPYGVISANSLDELELQLSIRGF